MVFSVDEAQRQLSTLIERARAGEEILIGAPGERPLARLSAVPATPGRVLRLEPARPRAAVATADAAAVDSEFLLGL